MHPYLSSTRDIILFIEEEIGKKIIGQKDMIRKLIIALFAGGHILIEGVPGLGKTKTVKTLADVLGYSFGRVSFTPDLLPGDLTGTEIYRPQTGKFEIRKGPIFTHIFLADEINRTPPKVQSALLEAMEEGQVTIGDRSLVLPKPFFVIATQNPLEHEGTYPLPEAELDRFMMKIILRYPGADDEKRIFRGANIEEYQKQKKESPISAIELIEMRKYIEENIRIDEKIFDYISDILEATRDRTSVGESDILKQKSYISYGASTRAGIAYIRCSRVLALLEGRDYVMPEDIKSLAYDILRHRIGISYEGGIEGITTDHIIKSILNTVRIS